MIVKRQSLNEQNQSLHLYVYRMINLSLTMDWTVFWTRYVFPLLSVLLLLLCKNCM